MMFSSKEHFIINSVRETDPQGAISAEELRNIPMEVLLRIYPDLVMAGKRAEAVKTVKDLLDGSNNQFSPLAMMLYKNKYMTSEVNMFLTDDSHYEVKFHCEGATEEFVLECLSNSDVFRFTSNLSILPVTWRFKTAAYFYIISEWQKLSDPCEVAAAHIFASMVNAVSHGNTRERIYSWVA